MMETLDTTYYSKSYHVEGQIFSLTWRQYLA